MAEVEQRIAERHQLPVDHGGQFATVPTKQHVGKMEVPVDQARAHLLRSVPIEPAPDIVYPGNLPSRIAGQLTVAVELLAPAAHLALRPALESAEVGAPAGDVIDTAE